MSGVLRLYVALVREVFFGPDAEERLDLRLAEARRSGAELALLPELPLDAWLPAGREPRERDAEPPGGPRHARLAAAARRAGMGVVGGAIVRDVESGRRRSLALLFDARGELVARCAKQHLPEEPGFWETAHYEPGDESPAVIDAFGLPLGVQICSDVNRPEGSHALGALGAEAILCPRATEAATWERWRTVLRANAITSACWVVSVNRPLPEGAGIGGPTLVVAPDGTVVRETEEPLVVVALEREAVRRARAAYPGYLPVRAGLYARAWRRVEDGRPGG